MTGWPQVLAFIQGIVFVIFAIFCEYDSSSFSLSLRQKRSAQKTPKEICERCSGSGLEMDSEKVG
jgi:hypothetical protein